MLRGAVQEHEQKSAFKGSEAKSASSSNFLSSSQPRSSQSVNPGFRNPFKPATSSALNGLRHGQQQQRTTSGIKRTASGLAKALDGAFEAGPGSRHDPIQIGSRAGKQGGMYQVAQGEFIDENAFDSDIELDVEEPAVEKASSYPTLPDRQSETSLATPVIYPTLPRQQQAQTSFSTFDNNVYGAYGSAAAEQPIASSAPMPMPWSSSPAEHYCAALSPNRAKATIQEFSYKPMVKTQHFQNGPPPVPQQNPTKRRTLPWHNEEEPPQQPNHRFDTGKPKVKNNIESTPVAKPTQRPGYPWNTTASAIKDQQKKHREEVKKAVKKNEGDEESILKAKSSRERPARVFLSEEQQHVLNLVTDKKKSVFFTGSAGTGKSVLMREIITALRKTYKREPDRVAVTASTGLAACNVGGVTLHSFAGIGLGKEEVPELVRKIKRNQKAKHRWLRTKVLVVDEVSMVDADLFDKLEAIARQLRNNGRPFGGIQLVITGDFFQLPPVPDYGRVAKFAFDAAQWNTTIDHTIGLHHVFRQKDPSMCPMLYNVQLDY
jgi:ATP-dependent DNA helicase PIF1